MSYLCGSGSGCRTHLRPAPPLQWKGGKKEAPGSLSTVVPTLKELLVAGQVAWLLVRASGEVDVALR